jgi:spoIIIJ-associated protein
VTEAEDRSAEEIVRDLLEEIVEALELEATVVVTSDEDEVVGVVEGEDLGLFIGRHGATIDAVQHLAQRALIAHEATPTRAIVDAADYRARRREVLERQADDAVERALGEDRPVHLEAMNAAERRVVHEYLRDREDIETHSEGNEPERRLVVSPAA